MMSIDGVDGLIAYSLQTSGCALQSSTAIAKCRRLKVVGSMPLDPQQKANSEITFSSWRCNVAKELFRPALGSTEGSAHAFPVLMPIEEILPDLLVQAASQGRLCQAGKFTVKFGSDLVEDIE